MCGQEFASSNPLSVFCGSRRTRLGCAYIYDLAKHKVNYQKNRESVIIKAMPYYKDHRTEKQTYSKRYHGENKESISRQHKKYYIENRDQILEKKRLWHIERKYNLTSEQFKSLSDGQGGVCAICGEINGDRRLYVDHCHKTGKVRGLLCNACNRGLGAFKDNPDNLSLAVTYLKEEEKWPDGDTNTS